MTRFARLAIRCARPFLTRSRAEDTLGDLLEIYEDRRSGRGWPCADLGLAWDLLSVLAARPASWLGGALWRLGLSLPFGAASVLLYLAAFSDGQGVHALLWLAAPGLVFECVFWLRLLGDHDVVEHHG